MRKAILFSFFIVAALSLHAQYRSERYDTSYYISYRHKLTLGAIAAKKNTVFKTDASSAENSLKYLSNSPGRLGISGSHDFVGLAATFGVGRLDPSYKPERGKTKQTNLQLSITGRKVLADIYFQNYKGLYVNSGYNIAPVGLPNYTRPDIETRLYGTTVNLIQNSRKFSAQAAFLLDAWQRRSAGSLLYGGEFFYGSAKGDSAFIPFQLKDEFPHANVSKLDFITFGPGVGYGYTLVVKKHFFATAIASFNADVSYIKEQDDNHTQHSFWKFNPNLKAKGAIGYNSENWGIAFSYVSNRLFFKGLEGDSRYLNYNDNYKLMYARRINAGKSIPKLTRFAGKIINKVGLGFLIN
ncbi:DUF4421 family protein [Niabella yanshanensis]|uniref:DUF4421 family protein n=1 Tax=Niabella yanshanensis TaxID=577386 RepID=A0ABZ0W397_9BACT|nr:DUF4421 family protein [Niabella yanshanensis]WQD36566.1 DUF4421 family protein [Niabella yanshanensis]